MGQGRSRTVFQEKQDWRPGGFLSPSSRPKAGSQQGTQGTTGTKTGEEPVLWAQGVTVPFRPSAGSP